MGAKILGSGGIWRGVGVRGAALQIFEDFCSEVPPGAPWWSKSILYLPLQYFPVGYLLDSRFISPQYCEN